jgi:hypothetical protein
LQIDGVETVRDCTCFMRFYEELNDFLSEERRKVCFSSARCALQWPVGGDAQTADFGAVAARNPALD